MSSFILQKELLSITVTPFLDAIGANFSEIVPPAENKAISISLLKDSSFNSSTVYSFPINSTFCPADFLEENKYKLLIGKSLSFNTSNIVLPTIPVAPTTAKLTNFLSPIFASIINYILLPIFQLYY